MSTQSLTIAEMAKTTGVSEHTLRYYERIGLIDAVTRADNGHRRYGELDLRRVTFLKRLRATGMPIKQMQHYVRLYHAGDDTITDRRDMLEAHRAIILQQIDELYETVTLLDGKIETYLAQEATQNDKESETT